MAVGKNPHPPAWSRVFRRLITPFLTRAELRRIHDAIEEAQRATTARIRVKIMPRLPGKDALDCARKEYEALKLDRDGGTAVLIVISHLDHRFAIWGGRAVHEKAPETLGDTAPKMLMEHFRRRHYAEGIEACVREIGRELARHFPAP